MSSSLLSDGNTKYAKSKLKVLTWGLPAVETCPGAGECRKFCYATQGRQAWDPVVKKKRERLAAAMRPGFVGRMLAELAKRKWDILRIHDSGDFWCEKYLEDWLQIIRSFPGRRFFCYTKMVPMFKEKMRRREIPDNFKVIFSLGGRWDDMVSTTSDYHSRIFKTLEEAEAAGYAPSKDEFPRCFSEDEVKEALVYHGVKSYATCEKGSLMEGAALSACLVAAGFCLALFWEDIMSFLKGVLN